MTLQGSYSCSELRALLTSSSVYSRSPGSHVASWSCPKYRQGPGTPRSAMPVVASATSSANIARRSSLRAKPVSSRETASFHTMSSSSFSSISPFTSSSPGTTISTYSSSATSLTFLVAAGHFSHGARHWAALCPHFWHRIHVPWKVPPPELATPAPPGRAPTRSFEAAKACWRCHAPAPVCWRCCAPAPPFHHELASEDQPAPRPPRPAPLPRPRPAADG